MIQLSPKEKAQELYDKFLECIVYPKTAKLSAKICIEETMKAEESMWNRFKIVDELMVIPKGLKTYQETSFYTYNQEVLKELDKL